MTTDLKRKLARLADAADLTEVEAKVDSLQAQWDDSVQSRESPYRSDREKLLARVKELEAEVDSLQAQWEDSVQSRESPCRTAPSRPMTEMTRDLLILEIARVLRDFTSRHFCNADTLKTLESLAKREMNLAVPEDEKP